LEAGEDFLRAVEDRRGSFSAASEVIFGERRFNSFAGRL
jgi:hypothetical protein